MSATRKTHITAQSILSRGPNSRSFTRCIISQKVQIRSAVQLFSRESSPAVQTHLGPTHQYWDQYRYSRRPKSEGSANRSVQRHHYSSADEARPHPPVWEGSASTFIVRAQARCRADRVAERAMASRVFYAAAKRYLVRFGLPAGG